MKTVNPLTFGEHIKSMLAERFTIEHARLELECNEHAEHPML